MSKARRTFGPEFREGAVSRTPGSGCRRWPVTHCGVWGREMIRAPIAVKVCGTRPARGVDCNHIASRHEPF